MSNQINTEFDHLLNVQSSMFNVQMVDEIESFSNVEPKTTLITTSHSKLISVVIAFGVIST